MENSKLIRLLKSLNQQEIRQFGDFICSPAFNKKEILIKIFDELRKYYPEFQAEKLIAEEFFAKVFAGEEYDYFKLKNSMSDLFLLGKEFLSFSKYKKDERMREKYLLEELRLRNLNSFFEQTMKAANLRNESSGIKDEQYLNHKLNLTMEQLSFLTPRMPNKHLDYQQEMFDLFLKYSLIRIFKSYNVMMHEEKQNNLRYNKYLFDEIMSFVEEKKIDNPTLQVYYHIISLERNRNDDNFHKLKEVGAKYGNELNEYDSYMVFLHLNGYCTNEFNLDSRTDLIEEHFEIIKNKNNRDFSSLGKLLYPDFINEVKISLRANKPEWAEDYLVRNQHRLSGENESTLNFCNAILHLKKGDPDKALDLLSKTNFPNFIIKLQVKILQLQIFYEKDYFEQAAFAMDNFRHYLKRENTIKDNFKDSFYEFTGILNKLVKLKTGYFDEKTDYILDNIRNDTEKMSTNQFGIKLWLRDKVNKC